MHLEKMVFVGFKSFAERTEVKFRSRLTAVVGPNGCGKSNIVDAFRWALGEQSAKSLRGSAMSDVIFKGTDARPPAGYAEVSLHIHAPELAPKLGGERKLLIQRRLYRNGNSEYILNGRSVRLKEIRYLLADTGVGATYYSVIDQQNVDAILRVDATKRRELLEEAAGVRGYRMQRDSAASELQRAKTSLDNLTAKIEELKQQRRRLARQAAKARRHARLKDELRALKTELFSLRRRRIEKELAELSPHLEEARMRLSQLRANYESVSAELQTKQKERRRLEQLYSETEKQRESLSRTIKDCEVRIATASTALDGCREQMEHLRIQIASEQKRLDEFEERLKSKEAELAEIEERYTRLKEKLEELRSRSDELRTKVHELERRKGELLRTQEKLLEEEHRLKNEAANAKLRIESIEREERILQKEREDVSARLESIEERLRPIRSELLDIEQRREELSSAIAAKERRIGSLKRRAEAIRRRATQIREETVHLHAEREALQKVVSERIDSGVSSVVTLLRENGHSVWSLADAVECDGPLAASVALLLKPLERTLIVESDDSVRLFLEHREQLPPVHIRFVVLERLPEDLPPIPDGLTAEGDAVKALRYLCGGAEISDEPLTSKEEATLLGRGGLLVRGAVVEVSGEESILGMKQRIKEIESETERLERREEELTTRIRSLTEELTEEEKKNETLREELKGLSNKAATVRGESERLEVEKETVERRLSVVDSEIGFKKDELKRVEASLATATKSLDELKGRQEEVRRERALLEQSLNELRNSRLITLQNEEASTSIEVARIEEQLTARSAEVERLKKALESASERSANAEESLRLLTEKEANLQKEIEERERQREEALDEVISLRKRMEELRTSISCLSDDDEENEGLRERLHSAVEKARTEEQELALQETALKEQLQALLRNAEESGIEVDDSDKKSAEETQKSEEELKKEIEDCERKLGSLGGINETAVEELETVEGRLAFYTEQQVEVKGAVKRLMGTIEELDTICRERLQKIFEEVKEHFSSLFRRLFGGGKAELVLTSDDILESGLEVIARPPGKMNTTLSLLSGGERAMCAVALLFAIYRTRPSPICILDELDANLDDTNIASFVSLLREYSKTTQFIIITHSKQTISAIDDAVGVTMPKPGITEIVSVGLKEAAEMVA